MKRNLEFKDAMIDKLAESLRTQDIFPIMTYKECQEKFDKKTDLYFVRCYYPSTYSPSLLTAYVKNDYVWLVGHAEEFQRFESQDVYENMPYRSNLYKFKVVESFESGLPKTTKVMHEMLNYVLKMHPEFVGIDKN